MTKFLYYYTDKLIEQLDETLFKTCKAESLHAATEVALKRLPAGTVQAGRAYLYIARKKGPRWPNGALQVVQCHELEIEKPVTVPA